MDWLRETIPFEFGRPWWLLAGIVAIALTVAIARRSMAGQSRGWYRFGLWLRIFLVTMLTLGLADIRVTWKSDELTVLFAVDVSASVPAAEVRGDGGILDRVADAAKSLPKNERAGLIVFGRDAAVVDAPGSRLERRPLEVVIDAESTDIASALRLADATFTHSHAIGGRRVVLISDGNDTQGDALLEARNLAVGGAVIDVLPLDYEYREEILVDSVQVPSEVHPEEPYVVAAIVHSELPAKARVQLHENEKQIASLDVDLVPGKNRVEFPIIHSTPQRYRYEVRVFPQQSEGNTVDTIVKNNVGHGFTLIRGSSRVLFIGDPTTQAPVLDALAASGIAVDVTDPTGIPPRPESYFLYDTIIVADVPAFELGTDAMRLLHGVVKNLGLGFIMIGGPDSFGAGGYKGTPIEKLLPVEMDIKQRKILPNGALVLILHTCEFPRGNMWAKRIATAAIEVLTPKDYVGVLVWSGMGADTWGVPFGPASDKQAIVNKIRNLQPADMQSFAPSMRLANAKLQTAKAQKKHVIIISDGDPSFPDKQTMDGLIQGRISVTTICIQPHNGRDTGTLKKIAKDTGGRYYFVNDPRKLPQIFVREALQVHRSLIMEETFHPVIQYETEPIRGIIDQGLPPLHGFVLTSAKGLAETPLVSHQGDPVLSHWRYGLGKTAAFTTDAGGRWASDWVSWPGWEPLWAQMVRAVARRGGEEVFRVERTIEGDRGKITLDAIDAEGRYIDGLSIKGQVMSPRFDEEGVKFRQTGPGRYEAAFGARQSGTYLVSLDYDNGEEIRGAAQTGLTVSYSPEFRALRSDHTALTSLAAATGGRVLDWESDFFDHNLPLRLQSDPKWESLVQWLLVLLFVDIFCRRVLVSFAPVMRLIAALRGRKLARQEEGPVHLGALLAKKDEARATEGRRKAVIEVSDLPADGAGDASDSTAAQGGSGTGGTGTPASSREAPKPASGAGTFTDRLLEAKKRAHRKK